MDELKDLVGLGQILESVPPRLRSEAPTGKRSRAEAGGDRRQDCLAAVGSIAEACAAVDCAAVIVAFAQVGLAGMQREPHA